MKLCRLASLLLLAATLFATSCTTDDLDNNYGGGATTFIIEARLPELGGVTRADVDADNSAKGGVANIDWSTHHVRIIARAYDTKDSDTPAVESVMFWTSQADVGSGQVSLPMSLTYGKIYNIYMWVDIVGVDHDDLHYNTQNLPAVTYTAGDGPAVNDETYDAFYGYAQANLTTYGVITWSDDKLLSLQRAVSKLRIIADDSDNSAQSATLALEGTLYNGLKIGNPISYSGYEIANPTEATGDIITYGNDTADAQTMITAYLLTPAEGEYTVTATLNDASSNEINSVSASNIPLHRGKMTTLRGSMFSSGEAWDGQPVEPTEFDGEWMIINTAGDLLWLATTSSPTIGTTTYSKFRLGANIDVRNSTVAIQSLNVGNGATFDGNGKSIKGFGPTTSALFGSVSGITVTNLTIEGYNATAETHIGVLVNELTGTSTFSNITIKDSSVTTTNGAAGGMVGYIRRANETARAESYSVTFSNCHTNGVTANGSLDEGYFVGYFSGYDLNEHLTFDATCTVSGSTIDAPTLYEVANQSCWLPTISDTRYNGMLGGSKYLRGRVTFGNTQFAPKWDGETTIDPLVENNSTSIYTPFDLAHLQGATITSVTFKDNIDMNGAGPDGVRATPIPYRSDNEVSDDYIFNSIYKVQTLEGNNKTLYNLSVERTHDGIGAGFIQYADGTTIHQNLTLHNADIKNYHTDSSEGNAYAGTMVATVTGTYTGNNIKIVGGNMFAICKTGGLYGRLTTGTFNISNCSVDGMTIRNYDSGFTEDFLNWDFGAGTMKIEFESDGEIGGLIGFITGANTSITNCSVKNCNFYCTGEADWELNLIFIAAKVPGRHINPFIGDIRTTSGETITISNYTISNNNMHTSETSLHGEKFMSHKYKEYKAWKGNTWDCVGFVYAVTVKFNDVPGTVKINNSTVMVSESFRK